MNPGALAGHLGQFTDRGQTRNVEAGVLIDDKAFSEQLGGQWRQLVNENLVRRYRG
jgi:hypothetical protein